MIFISVAPEAITAVTMTLLLLSDEFCFIWILEQSAFVGIKTMFVPASFVVVFIYVGGTGFVATVVVVAFIVVVDALGVSVVTANLVIGS